jgi:hypothetical protein
MKVLPYTALSYAWGSLERNVPILLNGMLFHITHNLSTALDRLQHLDIFQPLWVDASCINQGDDKEKTEQVQRMWSVYNDAESVIAWLGPGIPGEFLSRHSGMWTLERLGEELQSTGAHGRLETGRREQLYADIEREIIQGTLPVPDLIDIFERPFWTRI